MENKDLPAYPQPIAECQGSLHETMDYNNQAGGLSKRELISAMALSGYISMFSNTSKDPNPAIAACKCVAYADALLTELSKPQP